MPESMSVAIYAADRWEHVCPQVRTLGPLEGGPVRAVRGNWWEEGVLRVDPGRVDEAALVLIQRDFPRHAECAEVIARARQQGKPVLYELDDLLTELPVEHPDVVYYRKARAAILQTVIEADAVIGSTDNICAYLRRWNPNVQCLPNYLNDRLWPAVEPCPPTSDCPVRVGYMGGHGHTLDLALIDSALEAVWARFGERVEFVFWGVEPPERLRGKVRVTQVRPDLVSYAEFAQYFARQQADIFLAPLRDNLFNRCKSSLKFLEYAWLGVPGIYSRIVTYEGVVEDGVNGLLAGSREEWEDALAHLIEDPLLRATLGAAARSTVEARWRLSDHAHEWPEAYRKVQCVRPTASQVASRQVARQVAPWYGQVEELLAEAQEQIRSREATIASLRGESSERERERDINNLRLAVRELQEHGDRLQARYDRDTQELTAERDRLRARHERDTHNLELAVEELRGRAQRLEAHAGNLERFRTDIENSYGWRALTLLWRARVRIAPIGSRRERLMRRVLSGLVLLKRGGPGAVARRLRGGRAVPPPSPPHSASGLLLTPVFTEPRPCPVPAVTVLLIRGAGVCAVEIVSLRRWLATQTCGELAAAMIWDRTTAQAYPLDAAQVAFSAPDWPALQAALQTPYLCVASPDLLDQVETYLEAHLIALETEGLALSVYLNGRPKRTLERLTNMCLPGSAAAPLLRQVARVKYVRDDLSLDLGTWLADQELGVAKAGRIIPHSTNHPDDDLPMERRNTGPSVRLEGTALLVRRDDVLEWSPVPQPLRALSAALPGPPAPADPRPTVIVLHPFLAVGGAERMCYDLMRALRSQVRFVVVTVEPWNPALGTTADRFREITPYVYTAPDYLLSQHLNYSLLEYLIARFQPQSLYIANGANFVYDSVVALRRQYPRLHIANEVYDHQVGWINRYTPEIALAIDAHIGCNRRICQAYIERGVPLERVHQIEAGLDPAEWNPEDYDRERRAAVRAKLGVPEGKKIVTFAARFHQQKRPLDFVELARRYESDPGVRFLMFGDGPLGETVDTELSHLQLPNLRRLPFHSPMGDVYAITDVFVLPSEYEGMPLVILEAQAMGTPVVVTDVGNNREIIEATGGGVVISNIGDSAALQTGVGDMLTKTRDPEHMRAAFFSRFHIRDVSARRLQAILPDPARNA